MVEHLPIHTESTAPAGALPLLENAKQAFGFVPNLLGILASSPAALDGYMSLNEILGRSSLSPIERQVVMLTVNRLNDCRYCMAAHTTSARGSGMNEAVVEALRRGDHLDQEDLEALRGLAEEMVTSKGRPSEAALSKFSVAGYTGAHLLDVVLCLATKTLSNYANHLAHTPLDDAFAAETWKPTDSVEP